AVAVPLFTSPWDVNVTAPPVEVVVAAAIGPPFAVKGTSFPAVAVPLATFPPAVKVIAPAGADAAAELMSVPALYVIAPAVAVVWVVTVIDVAAVNVAFRPAVAVPLITEPPDIM